MELCQKPAIRMANNGQMERSIGLLEKALTLCAIQVESTYQCQQERGE